MPATWKFGSCVYETLQLVNPPRMISIIVLHVYQAEMQKEHIMHAQLTREYPPTLLPYV